MRTASKQSHDWNDIVENLYLTKLPEPGGLVMWDPDHFHFLAAAWVDFPLLRLDPVWGWTLRRDLPVVRLTCSSDDRLIFLGSVKQDSYFCAVLLGEYVIEVPITSIIKVPSP